MTSLRFPQRFRSILGDKVESIGLSQLELLKGFREADDFEVKSANYGNGDSEKRELATDIASIANARGGLLLIGATEENDVVQELTPVALSGEALRIHQIVANSIVPPLSIEVHPILDGSDSPERGYLLIVIPNSQLAPHAIPFNDNLRYVVRDGPRKRAMGESEVAQRYRARFNEAVSRDQRLGEIHDIATCDLDLEKPSAWLVLSAIPGDPGNLPINQQAVDETRQWFNRLQEMVPYKRLLSDISHVFTTGVRRVIMREHPESNPDSERLNHGIAHLFGDGSVGLALKVSHLRRERETDKPVPISDENLCWMVCAGLLLIGQHSDRCAASGELTLMCSLVSGSEMQITESRSVWPEERQATGSIERLSRTVSLGDITEPGPALVATASQIHSDLSQGFGWPQSLQLTSEGSVDWRHVGRDYRSVIEPWCNSHNIEIIGRQQPTAPRTNDPDSSPR
jgi:Putative DNA-binding domain